MRHRGPDGVGASLESNGQIVLEHCRLAIIDPENSAADQPFTDRSRRWSVVYNGEIFNFHEIRHSLERRGIEFTTNSDTEVLLQSLAVDGKAALSTLRGMFAFVLWDDQKRELLAARDQIGVKPLYFAVVDDWFIAASEIRTVVAHPAVRPRLDPTAVVEYLAFGYVAGDRTLLQDIHKLPPGHALSIRDGSVDVFEYWDVLSHELNDGPFEAGSLSQRLLAGLDSAVSASLVSDVPISLMLSGGLDSSAIAALATRHANPSDITAYSVSFGLPDDESDVAAALARDLGLQHREVRLTKEDVRDEFATWLDMLDVPTANPTWIAVSVIARAVHQDGIKVLLSGDGGDELFGGYNRWMTYLRFHDRVWARTPDSLRRTGGLLAKPFLRGLAGDMARRASAGGDLFVNSRPFHDDDLRRCLGPVAQTAATERPPERPIEDLRRRFDERAPASDYLAWMSYAALKTDLVEDYLVRLDTMGMRHAVEGRVPLLDPQLASWALSLSQSEKVDGYRQKELFRQTVSPLLPEYIRTRPKQGFCPPVALWAREFMTSQTEGMAALVEQGLIAPDAQDRLRNDVGAGASFAEWGLQTLASWYAKLF